VGIIHDELVELRTSIEKQIEEVETTEQAERYRVQYLGRKGIIAQFFKRLGELSQEERPLVGEQLNSLKTLAQAKLDEKLAALAPKLARQTLDLTLPGIRPRLGTRHPLLQVLDEIKGIFISFGFAIESGPEVESEYYNFEALNIPADHPSRDLQDTLYLEGGYVLRTHTSPVQIRTMEKKQPPVRIIAPGRCFRKDTPDATHSPMFHQVEGLCVDEGVSFADLKGTILAFAQALFGPSVKIRFRPSFFPFTEPSAEYDFSCVMCNGRGCRVCKGTGWLEISGAGMVDPAVFGFVSYDSERFTGYAFGMGVERIAMLKYGVEDIRTFYENDVRFLDQF
jgi:phenylalanyl-tRNA synthetase alpha chain